MDCLTFLDRLHDLATGACPAEERQAAARHAAVCPDCAALLEDARGRDPSVPAEGPDLVGPVMERTSGRACRRAEDLIPDAVDSRLDPGEAALLGTHLLHCGACRALADAVREMAPVLSSLAELDPGAPFTKRVLEATSRRPAHRWTLAWFAEQWRAILARPRLGFEVAYIGAVLFVLVFGNPAFTLQATSARTHAIAQAGLGRARATVPALLDSVRGKGAENLDGLASDLSARREAARHEADTWWSRALEFGSRLWTSSMEQLGRLLDHVDRGWAAVRAAAAQWLGQLAPQAGREARASEPEPASIR